MSATGLAPTFTMPLVQQHLCANGLTLTYSDLATTPMVQAHLSIPVNVEDAADVAAVDVLSACWPQSAAAYALEQRGGSVNVWRRRQWLTLSVTAHADSLQVALDALAVATDPHRSSQEVATAAQRCAAQSRLVAAQPAADSVDRLWRRVYGVVPPLLAIAPAEADVRSVAPEQVATAHARLLGPHGAHLIVVGDIAGDDLPGRVEDTLGGWTSVRAGRMITTPIPVAGPGVGWEQRDGLPTVHLRLAAESLPADHPWAYSVASLASLILGGNFSSLLNDVLRETHGLAYRTTSCLDDHGERVMLVVEADVRERAAGQALELTGELLDSLGRHGPESSVLRAAVGYTVGSHELALGSQHGRSACLLSYLTKGLDVQQIESTPQLLADVTPDQIQAVFQAMNTSRWWGSVIGASVENDQSAGGFTYV